MLVSPTWSHLWVTSNAYVVMQSSQSGMPAFSYSAPGRAVRKFEHVLATAVQMHEGGAHDSVQAIHAPQLSLIHWWGA